MQLAERHPDTGVTLSPGISVGVEYYCTKMRGEESQSKMPSFDKGFRYYHKGFKVRWINNTAVHDKPCLPGDFYYYELPLEVPLETILDRSHFFPRFISFDKHLLNINHGPGPVLGTPRKL